MKDNDIRNLCSMNGTDKARVYREMSMGEGNSEKQAPDDG
jgi:hypothetical protein